jgi:hypothetical protein
VAVAFCRVGDDLAVLGLQVLIPEPVLALIDDDFHSLANHWESSVQSCSGSSSSGSSSWSNGTLLTCPPDGHLRLSSVNHCSLVAMVDR